MLTQPKTDMARTEIKTIRRFISSIFIQDTGSTWGLHASEAFICKALKAEAIVYYASALITRQMEASGAPIG
jgi:hypothetical protein